MSSHITRNSIIATIKKYNNDWQILRLVNMTDENDQKKGYDRKFVTPTYLIFLIWPKFTRPTNINLTLKKYAGEVGLDRSPSPGLQARTG